MTSVYAVSVLVLVCLYAQAPAQGSSLKLLKVTRTKVGSDWKLDVEYEGNVPNDNVIWYKINGGKKHDIDFTNNNGVLSASVNKEQNKYDNVHLYFGEARSQLLNIQFNTYGEGDKSWELNFPVSEITPGTEVTFEPGMKTTVDVEVGGSRGNGHLTNHKKAYFTGAWLDPETNTRKSAEQPPFLKESFTDAGDVTTTKVTFSWDKMIRGYFSARIGSYPKNWNRDGPVRWIGEIVILSVNADGNMNGLEHPLERIKKY